MARLNKGSNSLKKQSSCRHKLAILYFIFHAEKILGRSYIIYEFISRNYNMKFGTQKQMLGREIGRHSIKFSRRGRLRCKKRQLFLNFSDRLKQTTDIDRDIDRDNTSNNKFPV